MSSTQSRTPRLYVPQTLSEGGVVAATPAQAHHLLTVLRRHAGDEVRVFEPLSGEFLATIAAPRRNAALFEIGRQLRGPAEEPGPALIFCILKRDTTDLVVEKATELGVRRIIPVISERSNASRVNEDRLRAIAIEAAEQSERLTIPVIEKLQALSVALDRWPKDQAMAAAIERTEAPPPSPDAAGLLIGPEGGFTPRELDALRSLPFIQPASLGPRVLRAETACIAGLAIMAAR